MASNFSWLKTQLLVEAALAVAIAVMRSMKSGSVSTKVSKHVHILRSSIAQAQ